MNSADEVPTDFAASSELSKNHQYLRNETRKRLKNLFAATPALRDLHCDITPEEIAAEIAIINGDSIKVYVTREPYQQIKVIVPKNGTVRDLKAAIRRSFTALQNRQQTMRSETIDAEKSSSQSERRHSGEPIVANISWKYIWRTYYLQNDTEALTDDEKTLRDYGIRSKSVLKFVKKIKIDRRSQINHTKMNRRM